MNYPNLEDPDKAGGVPAPAERAHRIAVLPPEEARKIAAGEVVDRPAALVRDFLDNAIDSGAARIEVFIDGGGCRRVEVCDDGEGMDRENLELCTLTHATSKIRRLDDLAMTETLGFRGEALAAAAAVSSLEILSSVDGREAWKLLAGPGGKAPCVEPARRNRGTSVRALGLFDTIPARKRFLKREGSEAMLCRQAFTDKALAFPGVEFHLSQEGSLKLVFPRVESLKERFAAFFADSSGSRMASQGNFLHEIHALGEGFRLTLVVGGPELYRNDRRLQFIFANHRRIQDYSLLQALEYGVQGWFPNGVHPVGAIYIEIDPALADFNIHPAKREARFADAGAIHHAVTTTLRNFLRSAPVSVSASISAPSNAPSSPPGPGQPLFSENYSGAGRNVSLNFPGNGHKSFFSSSAGTPETDYTTRRLAMEALLDTRTRPDFAPLPGRESPENRPAAAAEHAMAADYGTDNTVVAETGPCYETEKPGLRFIGQVFELFLLVEKEDRLFIIDQHAAHERILYNRFFAAPILKQELLVPIYFDSKDRGEDLFLSTKRDELAKLGILIEDAGAGHWQINALPEGWQLSDTETVEALRELQNTGENMAERWLATLSCHRAIKDGDYLDETSATALAEAALALPVPRCPHGRPIWVEISRNELYKGVRRL
ncbi:MAG: DNA mismatch repair endonuclease MutL [Treponema sp.]|jgi:DNA mismatch repair protein MutL|nr:DNA mismatch repair endonuclease MutL [Treponema sp.]